ncbi:ABC transporter substrate-binding protein [Mesorhizobium tianshanense]|uniref:Peptide/nickel transport system substrate-binding protein n=1 Tax=Mesorhizobium tianshanense TaxID=39844 RepID=A0A562NBR8_9HYPH|nr:ABC transporter substrate-binding protein [Mesorhizobium tianshanense]TWI29543.1 peptide/nickel transport system substrate-binding protein [Mesorhizobium tianshanense]GLS34931.1 ABC transporter substrate-binding protein [Mesorhizobium tianshanense]
MQHWLRPVHAVFGAIAFASVFLAPGASARDRPDLTVAVNSLGQKMDPADFPLATELRVYGSVFDNLIKRDFKAEGIDPSKGAVLVPALATAWTRIDGRTLELELRQGVKFHNGDELTSEDVAFTFSPERIFGANAILPSAKSFFGCWEPVQVLSRYKVRIVGCTEDPVIELKLTHYSAGIVNRAVYTKEGQAAFKRAPVGTGPLQFVEWKDGDYIKFKAFDDYFDGHPTFNSITFREVPETAARVAGLVSGDFDLITQVTPDQFPTIEASPDLQVLPTLLEQMQMLWIVGKEPAVSDKRVRQALAMSIDREAIVQSLWNNQTKVEDQFQLPTLGVLYDPNRPGVQFNPDRARTLLKEAGYSNAPVTLRVIANYYVNGEAAIQAIQAMWQAVGINAKLEIVENFTQAFAPGASVVMGGCGFELASPESLASCFFGDEALTRKRGFPDGIPGLDALAANLATLDTAKRRQTFQAMLDILEDEVPATPLYRTPHFFAGKRSILWAPSPDFRTDFRPGNLSFTEATR